MRALAALPALVLWSIGSMPARAYSAQEEQELQIGASVYNQLERDCASSHVSLWATLAQLLLGQKSQITAFAIDLLANVQMARFSRLVETRADESGAYICAEAGSPTTQAPPEFLFDHPTGSHRISDLERLFAAHPETFAHYTRP